MCPYISSPNLKFFNLTNLTSPNAELQLDQLHNSNFLLIGSRILDEVYPQQLRAAFKQPIRQLQRGKVLERMEFFEGCYLLSLDGTCVKKRIAFIDGLNY
jgi:hypothetical protein